MSKETSASATISPVILNQTNLIPSTLNNVYRYAFPGSAAFKGSKVAVSNIQIYYSWVNISASANNNTLSMIFPVGAGTVTVAVTIPDGTYTVADLNSYLQSIMVANGYYLVDEYATVGHPSYRYCPIAGLPSRHLSDPSANHSLQYSEYNSAPAQSG